MTLISLSNAIRSNKVDDSCGPVDRSARYQSTCLLNCPKRNNVDPYGREVCEVTINTKVEGCDTPVDRIESENELRPRFEEFITVGGNSCSAIKSFYDEEIVADASLPVNRGATEHCRMTKEFYSNGAHVGLDFQRYIRSRARSNYSS